MHASDWIRCKTAQSKFCKIFFHSEIQQSHSGHFKWRIKFICEDFEGPCNHTTEAGLVKFHIQHLGKLSKHLYFGPGLLLAVCIWLSANAQKVPGHKFSETKLNESLNKHSLMFPCVWWMRNLLVWPFIVSILNKNWQVWSKSWISGHS